MKTTPWTEHKPAYRAGPTVFSSLGTAAMQRVSEVLERTAEDSARPVHHENLTTFESVPELNGDAVPCDRWILFAVQTIRANRGVVEGACVRWAGPLTTGGYPGVTICGQTFPAHRLVAALTYGPEAIRDKAVHHTCEVKDCTNPDHLLPVTSNEHLAIHRGAAAPAFPPPVSEPLTADAVIEVAR